MDPVQPQLPRWAPRINQNLLRRLYETDASGICDEELIDEVGSALFARCESFIAAVAAAQGRAVCPACGAIITHDVKPETVLHCGDCGWQLPWREYFKTIQHQQLSGDERVLALFQTYLDGYNRAKTPREKMVLIDQVIHAFHENLITGPRRTTGVNLIKGNYHEVVHFLDQLSYGAGSTPGTRDVHEEWQRKMNQTAETWNDERLRLP